MPWESEGDQVRFSGNLAALMNRVMAAYEEDTASGDITASAGVYATATAIVLREIVMEGLAEQPEAAEFLVRVSDALEENEDGTVAVQTLAILDEVAEHIEAVAWEGWLADPGARSAIAEVAASTFSE
jgi:hypothetical protein